VSWADIPTETAESRALAKALKAKGFTFVGPVTMYALMQACGLVDCHFEDCPARWPRG
jgi:DNA-3-methyladenine glycosylase I